MRINCSRDYVAMRLTSKVLQRLKSFFEGVEGVEFVLVYGSTARGKESPMSDVDVAISFYKPPSHDEVSSIILDLAKTLKLVEDKVDLLLLRGDFPLELLFKVVRDGVFVTGSLESYKKFRNKTISMYLDFKVFKEKLKLREKYLKTLIAESSQESS